MAEQQQEMYLYKLEAVLGAGQWMTVIVTADSDEKAFRYAEHHLLQHTVAPPQFKELSIVQKKPLTRSGIGYVVETSAF